MRSTINPNTSQILWLTFMILLMFPGIIFPQSRGQLYDLLSVSFPNDNDGWACGRWGTIVHTTDGGSTWIHQRSNTDYTLSSIFFIDPKIGWAVGDRGTILHTKDGGKNWVRQQSPVPYFLMGVCFVTFQKGWITTEKTTILYTEDGGQNWKIQFKDKDFILKRASFCDERNGWAVGEYGHTYHTDNGGKSWQKQAGYFAFSKETGEIVGGNFLFNVIAIDAQTAVVVGMEGYIAGTTDGGKSWQRKTSGVPNAHLFGIAHKKGLFVIGGNALLLTSSDWGKTFKKAVVEPQITYGWIYSIVPRGDSGFVAVGKEGWIYLGDKTGASWHRVAY